MRHRQTSRLALALAAMVGALTGGTGMSGEAQALPGLTSIETVCVDAQATHYGTFQSHNQKVLSNRNGIFMTHIRSRNEPYTAQQWRLSRSRDGGRTFATVFEATHATNPPVIETDENGNVYLVRPDFIDGNAYLYRFLAAEDYSQPHQSTIPNGSAGKFAMVYDRGRAQLYYFAHNNTFHTVGLDGAVRASLTLLQPGPHAVLQYPLLSLETDGTLHAAWTTQKHGVYMYWDIHHLLSRDGGVSWQKLDGTLLTPPVVADDSGPTDRLTLDDEFEVHTWLSSFLAKDGKLHFFYEAQATPAREHYLRYDIRSGRREVDRAPEFRGSTISLLGLDGFVAARCTLANGPLYCVSTSGGRIACLASDDNGDTWYDYAVSERPFVAYAIGGCRELTADGYLIGSFTESGTAQVHFLTIRAGLSTARATGVSQEAGKATVSFADVRGQPAEVRLGDAGGAWSAWVPFAESATVALEQRPVRFQLKSRLGVESAVQEFAGSGDAPQAPR